MEKYGSFAEGELASETPITCTLNNRYYDAEAPVVYNNANKIFGLGYTHAGEAYDDATFTTVSYTHLTLPTKA